MNQIDIGKKIAKLRKEAGYTQQELADLLFLTDKAISKWERGICMPDSSVLPKLARIFEVDIEEIIPVTKIVSSTDWVGVLDVRTFKVPISTAIGEKNVFDLLLSYFMLVGINQITVLADRKADIDRVLLTDYSPFGLVVQLNKRTNSQKQLKIESPFFLFGTNLTRQLQATMEKNENTIILSDKGCELLSFCVSHKRTSDYVRKKLWRGTVSIPFRQEEDIQNAREFIEIYERYHTYKIADLSEIAVKRGFVYNAK